MTAHLRTSTGNSNQTPAIRLELPKPVSSTAVGLLVRMQRGVEGGSSLAIGADRDRMLAMLSVAYGRPVVSSEVMPHVETAADLWRRGDRALANLRLTFSCLAASRDPAASHRVALAANLLDQGWPPAALMEELGLATNSDNLEKYNHSHVPAGNGRRSGQFDFWSGAAPGDGRIVVAANDEDEKAFEEREILGVATP